MCSTHKLEPFDLLVYASIKRFMNSTTREAWPSMTTLKALTGSGQDRIKASIEKLKGQYFETFIRAGRRVYVFSKRYKNFEPFSKEFLDMKNLTPLEKSYLIAAQQYMFKDINSLGKISFTTKALSYLINMPEWEIWKCDRALANKGYLDIVKTKKRNFETGLQFTERIYNMDKLGQQIIWLLNKNTERIKKNSEQILKLQKDLKTMQKLLAQKDKQIARLKQPIKSTDSELFLQLE